MIMKKIVILLLASITLLCANATDRFYIEDFSISAGETRTVSIILENETAYTAFQTDLYLPAGLTVEQEDGDYIFDLTSRKGRDHNIATQVQADGAIRIMSYSPTIKAYSGNSGALVTFNVTATEDFTAPTTIQLKNTLLTTKNGVEVAFNDETCNVTSDVVLKDLTGEITFTPGGESIELYDYDGVKSTSYDYLDICYSGPEDVEFTIIVNGYDLFKDNFWGEQKSNIKGIKESEPWREWVEWIDDINGYRIDLYGFNAIKHYFDEYDYCGSLEFEVTVHAKGYNEISNSTDIVHMIPPYSARDGADLEVYLTDYEAIIIVSSGTSGRCLLINEEEVDFQYYDYGDDYVSESNYYVIDRQDVSFSVTAQGGAKTMGMDRFVLGEEMTIEVPALNNGVDIIQCGPNGEADNDEENHYAVIKYHGDAGYYVPTDFMIDVNGHVIYCYVGENEGISVLSIDEDILVEWEDEDNENLFNVGPVSYRPNINGLIIDLLPFGNIYGGNYDIQSRVTVFQLAEINNYSYYYEHEKSADAHFEYYVPIEAPTILTQMTNDAVIVNMSSDLEYKKFIVDGEEVLELPYVAGRTNHDYYITVQAGHSPDSVRWAWTEETTILIPAKDLPILRGDADGDGNVNISDVAALIDYLLSGNDALVPGKPDVDLNGAITIADVTTLIDYLLSDRWPGETSFTVNGVTFKLLDIAGGIFSMGATPEQEEGAHDNEKPVHEVALSPFSMSVTEVTQELWLAVMRTNPSRFSSNLNRPVENVSWNDCQVFIAKLNELTGQNFRLPTEAEWEFAARGGMNSQGYKYAGSNDLDEVAWYNYNAHAVGSSSPDYGTHAVATKAPNELGLYDMTGNVWEWCQDWSGTYSEAQQINPTGPETGTNRVMRGGGWTNYPSLLRIAARAGYKPTFKGNFTGLRLVL
jgi:formylglycine-generating enzyme required for sulfatase activity